MGFTTRPHDFPPNQITRSSSGMEIEFVSAELLPTPEAVRPFRGGSQ
jgi:hypothetical protein